MSEDLTGVGMGQELRTHKKVRRKTMKTVFSRDETERLLRILEWVDTATMDTEAAKTQLKNIAMKLRVVLKERPEDQDFEFLVK